MRVFATQRRDDGTLTLTRVNKIVEAALAKAHELGLKPMTVAVLDAGGHLVAFNRQDRSSILRPQIAHAKAWGAVGMGLSGRALAERAASHGAFVTALGSISDGRIAPVPGGVLILDADGDTLVQWESPATSPITMRHALSPALKPPV